MGGGEEFVGAEAVKLSPLAVNVFIGLFILALCQIIFAGPHIFRLSRWPAIFVYAFLFFALMRMPRLRKAARTSVIVVATFAVLGCAISMVFPPTVSLLFALAASDAWFPLGTLSLTGLFTYFVLLLADVLSPIQAPGERDQR